MKSEISWKADESGRVVGPRLHDARMLSASYTEERQFSTQFLRVDGSKVLFELTGIHDFNLNLWGGEIVMDISIWPVAGAPQAWNIPDSPWNELYAGKVHTKDIPQHVQKVINDRPDCLLVQLNCSYGGSFVALCSHARFSEC